LRFGAAWRLADFAVCKWFAETAGGQYSRIEKSTLWRDVLATLSSTDSSHREDPKSGPIGGMGLLGSPLFSLVHRRRVWRKLKISARIWPQGPPYEACFRANDAATLVFEAQNV